MKVRVLISLLVITWCIFPQGLVLLALLSLAIDLFRLWFGRWSIQKRNGFRWTFVFFLLFLSRAFRTGRFTAKKGDSSR